MIWPKVNMLINKSMLLRSNIFGPIIEFIEMFHRLNVLNKLTLVSEVKLRISLDELWLRIILSGTLISFSYERIKKFLNVGLNSVRVQDFYSELVAGIKILRSVSEINECDSMNHSKIKSLR